MRLNGMKSIYKKLIANIRPICQIIGLVVVFLLPSLMNISDKVEKQPELTASQDFKDYIFYYIWNKGNLAIGIFLFVLAVFVVRKWNKEYMFNKGDEYKNYPYFWYWTCAKFLGYSECNLILVPIYMQFKLILRDTFCKYYCGELDRKSDDIISVQKLNFTGALNEVNIIISDTYPIEENQIPIGKRSKPTIIISRDNAVDHNRYDSPELVQNVVNEVRNLPINIKKVNIYATTNTHNTREIVQNAFKLGERSNIDLIIVFQQERTGNRKFEKKGKVVYKR